jgi:hypothetical protein
MNRFRFDLEGVSTFGEGFPLHLSLQGDLAQTLIQLRAIQAFDTRAMSYAIQRTVRCAARRVRFCAWAPQNRLWFADLRLLGGFHPEARKRPGSHLAIGR